MSLLEWLFERTPAPVGTIESGPAPSRHWRPGVILFRGLVALALVTGVVTWLALTQRFTVTAAWLAGISFYCFVGYWIHPRPEMSNVGWLGGAVDHPFRYTDDVNRLLLLLFILLSPGRFVTVGIRDLFTFARGTRVIVLPPRDE
jgi:hypothetical protein